MTLQIAALNGKKSMVKNREHCGTKLLLAILNFLINFKQHNSSPDQDSNPGPPKHKQTRQSLTRDSLSYKDNITHNLKHHSTSSLLFSL
jgi:hypothetical protein